MIIYHVLLEDLELRGLASPEQLSQRRTVTGILGFGIKGIFHEIEKGQQEGKT